jgi:hypothetical protein
MIEIGPQFVKSVLGMFNVYVALSSIPRLRPGTCLAHWTDK